MMMMIDDKQRSTVRYNCNVTSQVGEAYSVLSDRAKRSKYDRSLSEEDDSVDIDVFNMNSGGHGFRHDFDPNNIFKSFFADSHGFNGFGNFPFG